MELDGRPEFEKLHHAFVEKMLKSHAPPLKDETTKEMLSGLLYESIDDDSPDKWPYFDLEDSLNLAPKRNNRVWAYLHQFSSSQDIIELEGPLRIRRATIVENFYFREQNMTHAGSVTSFIIESKPTAPLLGAFWTMKTIGKRGPERRNIIPPEPPYGIEIRDLVTMIRLVCPSSVGYSTVILQLEFSGGITIFPVYSTIPSGFPAVFGRLRGRTCKLDEKRIDFLQKLWVKFRAVRKDETVTRLQCIMRALRRFNNAIASVDVEDEIVDLLICLETLFQSPGFRMVFYASYLLGLDNKRYVHARTTLDKAYDVRSKVVHGGSLKAKDKKVIQDLLPLVGLVLIFWIVLAGVKGGVLDFVKKASLDESIAKRMHSSLEKWTPLYPT